MVIGLMQSEIGEVNDAKDLVTAKSRLLIEDVVIEGNKLKETMLSFGISIG